MAKARWHPKKLDENHVIAGVHGFEHVVRSVAPHVAGCDRHDISSSLKLADPPKRATHRVYLLDTFAGGIGVSEFCFAHAKKLQNGPIEHSSSANAKTAALSVSLQLKRVRIHRRPL